MKSLFNKYSEKKQLRMLKSSFLKLFFAFVSASSNTKKNFCQIFIKFFFGFLQIFIREYFLLKKIADGKSRFLKVSRSRIYFMQEKMLRKRVSTDFSFLEIANFNKLRLFIIHAACNMHNQINSTDSMF